MQPLDARKIPKNKAVWLSYDLGLRGDYKGLFAWLDKQQAEECGHHLAFFNYKLEPKTISVTPKGYDWSRGMIEEIKESILGSVKVSKNDKIYLIWRDDAENKIKGEFIVGSRGRAPGEGYAGEVEGQVKMDVGE